jgi:5-methylcytosine-specific restriction endonuclease McrA
MANFSENKINEIWQKAKSIEGYDNNTYRQDLAGAWIQKDKYGQECSLGWEIDHMKPLSLGGTDCTENLQPLQWKNNRKKADNYPKFQTIITSNGLNNVEKLRSWYFKV